MKNILLCLILYLFTSCPVFAVESLDTVRILLLQNDTNGTIKECQRIISSTNDKELISQAYYIMGLALLKELRPSEARSNFGIILNEFKDTNIVNYARVGIADSYFQEQNFQNAYLEYKNLLSRYPPVSFKNTLQFKLARCLVKLGRWQEAKELFNRIKTEYPLSFEADLSGNVLDENLFYFTVQVSAFKERDRAQSLCEKLKQKGYDAFIYRITKDSSTYYRVRVGRFNSQEEAKATAEKLKQDGYSVRIYP